MSESKICAELFFILEQVPNSYISLLPNNYMNRLKENMSLEHYQSFDKEKVFFKQEFNKKTVATLEKIYNTFWK
jgi:hypothetical protein